MKHNSILLGICSAAILLASSLSFAEPSAIQTCIACHGKDGQATSPDWPNLTGQKVEYMVRQLQAFRDGSRENPLMTALVANMTDEQMQAASTYYHEQSINKKPPEALSKVGQSISGYCISCHGVQGKTVNTEWPNLAGQNKNYLVTQLKALRDGSRESVVMNVIAKNLTDEQIENVAEYYSQLIP